MPADKKDAQPAATTEGVLLKVNPKLYPTDVVEIGERRFTAEGTLVGEREVAKLTSHKERGLQLLVKAGEPEDA